MSDRKCVHTDLAPTAIGPYAQANRNGNLIFTSGQIPLDPVTGAIVGNDIEEQTERALKNIKAVVEAAGSSLDRVIKTTVFLTDIGDFAKMNEVYARFFTGNALPSRSTVQVSALPKNALIEIEVIAVL